MSLPKEHGLAGPQEGNARACLGWVQDNAAVLPVRYNRGLDRPAGGGKVDGTSAQQPLASASIGSPKVLTRSSSANRARRSLGSAFCCGAAADRLMLENPSKPIKRGRRRHASINGRDSAPETAVQFTPLSPRRGAALSLVSLPPSITQVEFDRRHVPASSRTCHRP